MNDFIYRLILSALSLMLFYGIYRLLLNKLALLNAGRAYLIITMLMALLIPLPWQRLMQSPAEIAFVVNLDMATIIPYSVQAEGAGTFNWWNLAFQIYLVPAVLLFLFFFYSNLRLMILLRKGEKVNTFPGSCHVEQRETSFTRFLRSFTPFRMTRPENARVILLDQEMLPFSWFGRIVMSRKDYESRHAESIIAHELTHIRQRHFIDLLLAELLIVLQWFNPAAWAYRNAVRDMHEYLADKGTIQSGSAITEYQRLLATLAGPVTAGIISNNMKHSTLKNRFTMMTKVNNQKPATFRLTIAIVAVTLVSFGVFISACQTDRKKTTQEIGEFEPGSRTIEIKEQNGSFLLIYDGKSEPIDKDKIPGLSKFIGIHEFPAKLTTMENDKEIHIEIWEHEGDLGFSFKYPEPDNLYPEIDTTPPNKSGEILVVSEEPPFFRGGDEARIKYLKENLTYPEEAKQKGIQGTVFVTFVVETDGSVTDVRILRGIGDGCDEEAIRVIENMPRWVPGKQRGQAVRVQFNMPIRFVLE
jgi:TonB family protein